MNADGRIRALVLLAALALPHVTPAACVVLRHRTTPAHAGCDEPSAARSIMAHTSATSCDLGDCPTAPTAPPGDRLAATTIVALVVAAEPEPPWLLLKETAAPPTHPPQA